MEQTKKEVRNEIIGIGVSDVIVEQDINVLIGWRSNVQAQLVAINSAYQEKKDEKYVKAEKFQKILLQAIVDRIAVIRNDFRRENAILNNRTFPTLFMEKAKEILDPVDYNVILDATKLSIEAEL